MAGTITIRDANGTLVDVSVDDITTLNGLPVVGLRVQRLKAAFGVGGVGTDVSAANPFPVTIANLTDGTAQFKPTAPAAATPANVAASITSVTLAAANAARRGLYVYNDGTANLFLKLGATASITSFAVKIPAGGLYELPSPYYRGVVDGIWDAANGNARITELT